MPEFFNAAFSNGPQIAPSEIASRLLVALLAGSAIAAIYGVARRESSRAFAMTLLLLCVLIAMVTQVVGDNVARAFSLVGALSIVRFRTVVRDTQDTAYVILAVIAGMAVGSKSLWVAALGIGVVALAEFAVGAWNRMASPGAQLFVVRLRVGLDINPATLVWEALPGSVASCELTSVGTAKQGGALEAELRVALRSGATAVDAVRLLSAVAGVQSVQLSVDAAE